MKMKHIVNVTFLLEECDKGNAYFFLDVINHLLESLKLVHNLGFLVFFDYYVFSISPLILEILIYVGHAMIDNTDKILLGLDCYNSFCHNKSLRLITELYKS
jgi:hypothetical protein